jgi:chromosome segregation protein
VKLKRLELCGFKSFADRTVFEFEDSVSALVGPNGSGKSNVVDAIKLVLGERSAQKLRGTEMTNVIFDGSEGRPPLNYAEVKLTIDNSDHWLPVDYDEVCICRRVDRTGQSEFLLNGKPCRLKDVRHLMLDTGVGTGCYSVIEQGQIDRILRANPVERRQVFEEASGINRFLEQKREAEKKLERVAENLVRLGDIVEEVERQLRSVKYQAARARTFKQQSERLERLRLAHGLHTFRQLNQERQQHARELEAASADKARLDQQQASVAAQQEAERARLQAAQADLAQARQRLALIESRLESLQREDELNNRRCDELDHQLDEAALRRAAAEDRARGLRAEIEAAAEGLRQCAEQVSGKSSQLDEARRQLEGIRQEHGRAQEALEARKAAVFGLFRRESQLGNQMELLAAEKRALQHRLERLEARARELAEQTGQAEGEQSRAHSKLEELHAEQGKLGEQVQAAQQALAQAQASVQAVSAQESETRIALSGKVARLELIEDLEARAEGVGSGVRKLLEARLPGTVGLVAVLLEVPMDLAVPVEAALGEKAQAVIFETSEQAGEALRLLGQGRNGRAELVVLDRLALPDRAQMAAGQAAWRRLSELVKCDARLAPVVELLLGNVFLAESAEAVQAALKVGLPAGARLVTPDGLCYGAEGIWSGGEPDTPSLISRRSELAELRVGIEACRRRLSELEAQKHGCLKQVADFQARLEDLSQRAEQISHSSAEMEAHLRAADSRTEDLSRQLELASSEQTAICAEAQGLETQSAELAVQSEGAKQDRLTAQQAVDVDQERLNAMRQQEQDLADSVNALGADLAGMREQHRAAHALLDRLRVEQQNAEGEVSALLAQQEADARRRAEAIGALEKARDERQSLEGERESLQAGQQGRLAAIQAVQEQIARLGELSQEVAGQREALEARLNAIRIAESEASVRAQDLLERIAEDCGVRLQLLELDPAQWRQQSPFARKQIREFCEHLPEPVPAEPVAAWYRALQQAEQAPPEQRDEGPETISLQEAGELRAAVLALADDPSADWAGVKDEMAELKAKVDRIGNVNVDAIREQEQLEMRFQFLTDQRDDLEKARRHERDIIRELNAKSRQRFQETFEQVRGHFQALFRKLFGGGSADLVLDAQAEDVLEAGIEMVARPPGKQTNSISLLSGGEKALTTIALLFAIFQAKPSPFCLLDEVDAPLDDANVERFVMLLMEFQRSTQFLVITHNKVTMSMAQVLYGLTMTDGVSRKISVKFEDVTRRLSAEAAQRAKAG